MLELAYCTQTLAWAVVKPRDGGGDLLIGLAANRLRTRLDGDAVERFDRLILRVAAPEQRSAITEDAGAPEHEPHEHAGGNRAQRGETDEAVFVDEMLRLGIARDTQRIFGEERQERIGSVVARAFGEGEQALIETGMLLLHLLRGARGDSCA